MTFAIYNKEGKIKKVCNGCGIKMEDGEYAYHCAKCASNEIDFFFCPSCGKKANANRKDKKYHVKDVIFG